VERVPYPEPWEEGDKIPWNEPEFSARMLREHLSQEHDKASRRIATIERQVSWIHNNILKGVSSRILDLGCGPGLYTSQLAQLGHTCFGIDFSPASINYAQNTATDKSLDCTYALADIRSADYGEGFNLIMLIFGEFNVFRLEDARKILKKARKALHPDGILLLEPHTFEAVKHKGEAGTSWYSKSSGLFSNKPHILLTEAIWNSEEAVAITRHYVIDTLNGEVTRHVENMKAYTNDDYYKLLESCGYTDISFHPSLTGLSSESSAGLLAITAHAFLRPIT
jgi:SAM-dependent methyltransferase